MPCSQLWKPVRVFLPSACNRRHFLSLSSPSLCPSHMCSGHTSSGYTSVIFVKWIPLLQTHLFKISLRMIYFRYRIRAYTEICTYIQIHTGIHACSSMYTYIHILAYISKPMWISMNNMDRHVHTQYTQMDLRTHRHAQRHKYRDSSCPLYSRLTHDRLCEKEGVFPGRVQLVLQLPLSDLPQSQTNTHFSSLLRTRADQR